MVSLFSFVFGLFLLCAAFCFHVNYEILQKQIILISLFKAGGFDGLPLWQLCLTLVWTRVIQHTPKLIAHCAECIGEELSFLHLTRHLMTKFISNKKM